ncbi:Fanconi anaemia protein FANCD2 [Thamnidium elegans]|nr:Fanconi anaemia protein FANCD2 [Thamnidium elegans]
MLRQATGLLELALRFSQENPNCIALIYDELAHLISEEDIDTRLQTWVKDNMTSDFTEYYVVAETDADVYMESVRDNQYIKLEPEKMMNLDEDDSEIIIKMYELFYNPDIKTKKQVIVPMSSIFNLIQSCEKKLNNGSLQDVDALFGCGVLLFKTDDIEDISPEEVEYACDMLFYTINWFREILNSFMFAEEDGFRERLVSRLRNMLQLEEMLGHLMRQIPTYAPLEFHTTVPVNLTTVKNSSQIISSAVSSESQETACSEHAPGPKAVIKDHKTSTMKFKSVDDLRPYMRAFSVHLLELLKYNQDIQKESEQLTCEEINYILKDLDNKLDIKIMPPPPVFFGKKKAEDKHPTCNATMLARMDAQNLMKKVVFYLPYILQTLENLYSKLQEKDIEPGRIEGSEEIVSCISLVFNILFKLLSWPDIQNSDNSLILHSMISAIASRISSRPGNSVEDELEQAFTYLSQYGDNVPQAKTALLLFNILQRLMVISENSAKLKKSALKVVSQIIAAPWFDWRDIKKEIPFLIEQFIELNEDSIDVLHELVNNTLPQFEEEGPLEILPLLKDETIVQHYQAVINQTVKAFDLLKNTDEDIDVVLVFNGRIVKIFERITYYVKAKEDRALIGILLKSGRLFIDQFTKHSIPFFTRVFKTHSSSVVAIFKDFQASTRMLQIICSHVKVLKEVALSAYVPPLKKALEIVIYQVKMLLTENRIPQSAFFMGALKHRDIRGVEISSQIPREPDYDEEDMNEEPSINSEQEDEEELPVASDIEEDGLSVAEEETLPKYKKTKPPVKKPKKPITKKPTPRKRKSPLSASTSDQAIRTSSVVPSSDEEEGDEAITISKNKNKRKVEVIEEEDGEDTDIFGSSDEEEEKEPSPSPTPISSTSPLHPPPQPAKESTGKRRRLGLGRPVKSSQKKIFNLTGHSGEDSD